MGGRIGYYWVPAGNLSLPSEPQSHVKALSLQIFPDSQAIRQELKLPTPQSINDFFLEGGRFCFFLFFKIIIKKGIRAIEITPWEKAPGTKPDDWSLSLRTHVVGGEN